MRPQNLIPGLAYSAAFICLPFYCRSPSSQRIIQPVTILDSSGFVMSKNHPFLQRYGTDLLVLLLFVVLTIQAAWPIMIRLDRVIIGQDSDAPMNLWADWWTAQVWRDPDLTLWQTDDLFYPQGANLAYHSFSHLNTLVSLTLRPLLGTLPAYNLAILLNYVLAGLAMFQLTRYLTNSVAAAILAGIVFAFNPHNQYQSAHPVLLSIWCFPWATLYLMRAVREEKVKYAVAAALFVFLGAATSILLLILLALWFLFLVGYFFFASDWPRPTWRILFTFGFLSALSVLPLLYPLLRDFLLNQNNSFIIDVNATLYITDIASPFIPHWKLWLVRGMYIGLFPFLFLFIARYRWRETRLWYLLFIGTYLLSIGPYPTLLGKELDITLPWSLPLVPLLRNPYRINILESLGLAMLVAYGFLVMAEANLKRPQLKLVGAVAAALLIFGEYTWPTFPLTQVELSPFYTNYLADVPDDQPLAMVPTSRNLGKMYMYYQTWHGHPMTSGTVSRPSAETFAFVHGNALLRAADTDLPPVPLPVDVQTALDELAQAGIAYLVVNRNFLSLEEQQTWLTAIPIPPVYEDHLVTVYQLQP